MIRTAIKGRQQLKNERYEGHYAIVTNRETSEKPIDQAQISPEAYRTVSTYTSMVRG